MTKDEPSQLDRSGIFYTSGRDQRRKLTRRAQWAMWSLFGGFVLGFLLAHVF